MSPNSSSSEDLVICDRISMRRNGDDKKNKPEHDGNKPAGSGQLQLGAQVSDDDSNSECVFLRLSSSCVSLTTILRDAEGTHPMQVGIHRVKHEASVAHHKRAYSSTNSSADAPLAGVRTGNFRAIWIHGAVSNASPNASLAKRTV
jgi:hypothetical protein